MDKFIHRQNFLLFERRLTDPNVTEPQRKVILRPILEEQEKGSRSLLLTNVKTPCASSSILGPKGCSQRRTRFAVSTAQEA
jgi:hypothetical protein